MERVASRACNLGGRGSNATSSIADAACGQAVFQGGKDVMNQATQEKKTKTVSRPTRVKKPNSRVTGPKWVTK